MSKVKIREVSGRSIWYEDGRFSVDGCQTIFNLESQVVYYLENQAAWGKAEDVKLMRIAYPYLQIWIGRYITVRDSAGHHKMEWYTDESNAVYFDAKTKTEEPQRTTSKYHRPFGFPDQLFIFDQAVWDEAKAMFSLMHKGHEWERNVKAEKVQENRWV